ncbi:MAG: SIS domain-containing protein [Candidatus Sulfotelmatobacter sp.]
MNPELTVPALQIIQGKYLEDILDEPRALEATLANLDPSTALINLARRLAEGKFYRVVLTGMGSSFHALHPLNLHLISHGFTALMVETSELVHYKSRFFDPKTLIVAVSQSGQSAEMIRLAEVNRKRSEVIAVTNTPQSPLVQHSTAALFTRAGAEFSVSCKTYVTALMVLKFLGDILCQRDARQSCRELEKAPPAAAEYLSRWKEHVELLAKKLRSVKRLFFVGRGASLAAVSTGALIIKESDHFHAEGMSSAAFRHGPFEMLSEDTLVVVFSGDEKTRDLNQRLLCDIQQGGGHAEFIGPNSSLEPLCLQDYGDVVRPILEIVPVQMITLALAALANREAGKFERAAKITTTE